MNFETLQISIARGQEWLEEGKQTWISETENGHTFKDNFVELLMMELSGRWDYVNLRIPQRRWNYFGSKPVIVPLDYPDDNDTNAVAFSVLKPTDSQAKDIIDEISKCTNADGIIQVHLDPNRPRIAPEVSANILTLFYTFGRSDEVRASLDYLQRALDEPDYVASRYYFMPEPLFFFCWRLLNVAASAKNKNSNSRYSGTRDVIKTSDIPSELQPLRERLITRITARIGVPESDNALCPAIRLLVCQSLDIENDADLDLLLELQEMDGGFGKGWYVRYGSCGIKIAHPGFVAVVAVEALKARLGSVLTKDRESMGHVPIMTKPKMNGTLSH